MSSEGFIQHIGDLFVVRVEGQVIRDDLITVHIEDRRQIALAEWKIELCDIGSPFFVRCCCRKVSVDYILCSFPDIAFIGVIFLFWSSSFEIKFLHQSLYFLVIDDKAAIDQLMTYSSDTVPALVLFEDTSNRIDDFLVLDFIYIRLVLFIVVSRSGQSRYFEQIS